MTERLSEVLSKWVTARSLRVVALEENNNPCNDELEDYSVKYEALFRSLRPELPRLEITQTSDDVIGVGFETRANVAKRLNVRNLRQGYATGFEPCEKHVGQLLVFLELVQHGKIAVLARCWPIFGLGSVRAVALDRSLPADFSFGPRGWLRPVAELRATFFSRIVRYEAWS